MTGTRCQGAYAAGGRIIDDDQLAMDGCLFRDSSRSPIAWVDSCRPPEYRSTVGTGHRSDPSQQGTTLPPVAAFWNYAKMTSLLAVFFAGLSRAGKRGRNRVV